MDIRFNDIQKRIDEIVNGKIIAISRALTKSTSDVITVTFNTCTRVNEQSSVEVQSDLDITSIDTSKAYTYLFFDESGVCLYVGTSKSIKTRLTAHLIKNPMVDGKYKTSSKIEVLYEYLGEGCSNKNTLKLILISVEPANMYGALEGQLIYKYTNMEPKQANWNLRED